MGVPPAVAAATAFGAYVNSQSYRAQGLETSADAMIGQRVRAAASYTYLDATVTDSFAGEALAPATNPAFPGIEIGQCSPLVGARWRPATPGDLRIREARCCRTSRGVGNSRWPDTFPASRMTARFSVMLSGIRCSSPITISTRAYQKIDLSGSYRAHPRLTWYASIENVGGEPYEAAAGFPALPRTRRTGVTVILGGEPSRP